MRARWRRVRAIELLVNLFVCLMSYLHLGRPRNAPRPARSRDHPPTLSQVQVLRGLWDDCSLMARTPHKLGSRGAANLDATFELGQLIATATADDLVAPPPGLQSSAFRADRAKFMSSDAPGFDPVPWLPVLEGATYLEPRLLETTGAESDLPLARFGADRREACKFAELIDSAGRLYLATPKEAPAGERMNVLAVYKSETVDRTVWDRRRRNCREAHLKGAASDLPGGYELCEIEVPDGQRAYVFADDIADMYPTFIAPPERARTNGMAIELTVDECKHLRAYRNFLRKSKSEHHGAAHTRQMLGLGVDDGGGSCSPFAD